MNMNSLLEKHGIYQSSTLENLSGILNRDVLVPSLRYDNLYSDLEKMTGPTPGNSIDSIISVLKKNQFTKRAGITLNGTGREDVPCLNVIQNIYHASSYL
jgi:hypothetical protein